MLSYKNKTNYNKVLIFAYVFSLVLPLINDVLVNYVYTDYILFQKGWIVDITGQIATCSYSAGYAILIMTAAQNKFKHCLPFAAPIFLYSVLTSAIAPIISGSFSIVPFAEMVLYYAALPLIVILISKIFAKYIKNEILYMLLTLFTILALKEAIGFYYSTSIFDSYSSFVLPVLALERFGYAFVTYWVFRLAFMRSFKERFLL